MDAAAPPVVTLSATYGAGGSVVGPRVAELLGVPFVDRAIPAQVSEKLAVPLEEALARDERAAHGTAALLAALAWLPVIGGGPPAGALVDERAFVQEAERAIHDHCRDGAVVLGRAGALVLADHARALHVRLDGPGHTRVHQGARIEGVDAAESRRRQRDADRARDAYVRHFYGADAADPSHYHLVIDSTALDLETCAQLVADAARDRARTPGR
jgi:hypothetical protein